MAADGPAVCSLATASDLEVLFEGALDTPEVAVVSDELLFVGGFEPLDDDFSAADELQAMFSCESLPVRAVILDMASRVPKGQKRAGLTRVQLRNSAFGTTEPRKVEVLAFIAFIAFIVDTSYHSGSL